MKIIISGKANTGKSEICNILVKGFQKKHKVIHFDHEWTNTVVIPDDNFIIVVHDLDEVPEELLEKCFVMTMSRFY